MSRALPLLAGLAVLAAAWAGPLPGRVADSFAAHMALHMLVVAVAAPLLALALAPRLSAAPAWAVAASLLDLVVIWAWHSPALHEAARSRPGVLALEQAMFLAVALAVWLAALARPPRRGGEAALAGALALFFTSMHMTLLGALVALAPRGLFHAGPHALHDQQLGGAIMPVIGGAVYLGGGLALAARVLRPGAAR